MEAGYRCFLNYNELLMKTKLGIIMGINKGKGAANLRKINSEKKRLKEDEKAYQRIQEWKKANNIPDVSYDPSLFLSVNKKDPHGNRAY